MSTVSAIIGTESRFLVLSALSNGAIPALGNQQGLRLDATSLQIEESGLDFQVAIAYALTPMTLMAVVLIRALLLP